MELRWGKRRFEDWDELRARLVAETSIYLTEALRHPELAVRIPMIPTGSGRFPPPHYPGVLGPVQFL